MVHKFLIFVNIFRYSPWNFLICVLLPSKGQYLDESNDLLEAMAFLKEDYSSILESYDGDNIRYMLYMIRNPIQLPSTPHSMKAFQHHPSHNSTHLSKHASLHRASYSSSKSDPLVHISNRHTSVVESGDVGRDEVAIQYSRPKRAVASRSRRRNQPRSISISSSSNSGSFLTDSTFHRIDSHSADSREALRPSIVGNNIGSRFGLGISDSSATTRRLPLGSMDDRYANDPDVSISFLEKKFNKSSRREKFAPAKRKTNARSEENPLQSTLAKSDRASNRSDADAEIINENGDIADAVQMPAYASGQASSSGHLKTSKLTGSSKDAKNMSAGIDYGGRSYFKDKSYTNKLHEIAHMFHYVGIGILAIFVIQVGARVLTSADDS